jgi:hypothetical protein
MSVQCFQINSASVEMIVWFFSFHVNFLCIPEVQPV